MVSGFGGDIGYKAQSLYCYDKGLLPNLLLSLLLLAFLCISSLADNIVDM